MELLVSLTLVTPYCTLRTLPRLLGHLCSPETLGGWLLSYWELQKATHQYDQASVVTFTPLVVSCYMYVSDVTHLPAVIKLYILGPY